MCGLWNKAVFAAARHKEGLKLYVRQLVQPNFLFIAIELF